MTHVYIAGAMTGLPGHGFPAFNEAADWLKVAGYEVTNPADTGVIDGWEWHDYLRYDLPLMLKCDGVAVLLGWRKSRGAKLEVYVAKQCGLTVLPVADWLATSG